MDLCPVCGLAAAAERQAGELCYFCRNPQCPRYGERLNPPEKPAEE